MSNLFNLRKRSRLRSGVLLVCFLLTALAPLYGGSPKKKGGMARLLPGESVEGSIRLEEGARRYATYRFAVPEEAFAVRVSLSDTPADLDLFLKKGEEIKDYSDVDRFSARDSYNESLFFTRFMDPGLEAGTYYLDVAYNLEGRPKVDGRMLDEIPFTLTLEVVLAAPQAMLEPGVGHTLTLRPEEGMFAVVGFKVPRNTNSIRIDVYDTDGDVDFMVARGRPAAGRDDALYISESYLAREHLNITDRASLIREGGLWYVSLVDQQINGHAEDVSLVVSLDGKVPDFLLEIPRLPRSLDSMERSLYSTVQVIAAGGTGSGCLVSSEGHILTNWHVIANQAGKASDEIVIAATRDFRHPPEELFKAEALYSDPELDMALLKVETGLYNQPLPPGYRFPYFELGDPQRLTIGQPLSIIGYPGIGGSGSKSSITLTQGILSGFERNSQGTLLKTDAKINGGNSGGAAIDTYFQLLGIPSFIIGEEGEQMGFVCPVDLMPQEWRDAISGAK